MQSSKLIEAFPDEIDRSNHIEQKQLLGLATSPQAAVLSRRYLYGTIVEDKNIRYIDDYIVLMSNKSTDYKKLIAKEFGDMTFDVVIGNPPYQDSNGGGMDLGQYQYMIDLY